MNWYQRWFGQPGGSRNVPAPIGDTVAIQHTTGPSPQVDPMPVHSSFTPRACAVLDNARREADRLHHNFVGTGHLLLGLIEIREGLAVNALLRLGLELETLRKEIEKEMGRATERKMMAKNPFTPRVKKVLALAAKEAKALNHLYVGTEHLLLGIIREGDGVAARVLKSWDIDLVQTRREILKQLDPNFEMTEASAATTRTATQSRPGHPTAESPPQPARKSDPIDTSLRCDVYCVEPGPTKLCYQNVMIKGVRTLTAGVPNPGRREFFELEHPDGTVVYVASDSVVKFCNPGVPPKGEILP